MINRLPSWFRQMIPDKIALDAIKRTADCNVHTVCQSARCPNISQCFKSQKITFMILGNICTRQCRFCAIEKQKSNLPAIDKEEPLRISRLVEQLGLDYVVITSVSRDDLSDGGASEFARTVELIKEIDKRIKVEILIPDFLGNIGSIETVVKARPDCLGHNLETVQRLYNDLRPNAMYQVSLGVLAKIKEIDSEMITKSSLMLGLGEKEAEVINAMKDLRFAGCDILTLGQYLAPSDEHYPIKEFISPEKFKDYETEALALGFKAVLAGPLVRSSYQADKLFKEVSCV